MKKILVFSILLCIILILFKYGFSNYTVEYKLNNYQIKTIYKNKRFYYEINDGNKKYNFDVYTKRKFLISKIKKINTIEDDEFSCIYPIIDGIETYPLCYKDNEFVDYNIIDSPLLEQYKKIDVNTTKPNKDFIYYNLLNDNEYIALWNYKGYYIMNGKSYKNVVLFEKDKYDNSLAYLLNDTIYMANNDEEHEFTSLISLNLINSNKKTINLGYNLDFDSYFVGNIKNNLYIFDNKYSILYEINTKNNKVKIIGNNEKGFVKYENGKFVSCSKNEYKINKIKYNEEDSKYKYEFNNGMYKTIEENDNIKQKINDNEIKIVKENNNKLYYSFEDYFYLYEPLNGNRKLFYNYELTFNSDNTMFVYIK